MQRASLIALATITVLIGGYLAVQLLPGDDPDSGSRITYTFTQTVPGVGSGGLVGTGSPDESEPGTRSTETFPVSTYTVTLPTRP